MYLQMVDKRIHHVMTLPFKTVHFQFAFAKINSCKIIEAAIMKKIPDDRKLIQVINILTVVSCASCFLLQTVLTQRKIKLPFFYCFDDVNVSVNGKQSF